MKSKIWPDDTTMVEMGDWLAELREDGAAKAPGARTAEPPGARTAEPPSADRAEPPSADRAEMPSADRVEAASAGWVEAVGRRARPAVPAAPAEPSAVAEPTAPAEAVVRPLIGDELRMPIMWCEMGSSCISWHADPAALGESDSRARAIGAGWRIDAFGRLACPHCQQTDPSFRTSRPVVLWDRATAIARAARIAARYSQPMAS